MSERRLPAWLPTVGVAIALVALVALAPVLLVVALVVRLSSPGPIFYTQTRVGQDRRLRHPRAGGYDRRICDLGGRVFRIYKFRTMRTDAEQKSGAVWATKNDPRVTTVGRIMRKTRLDELPQLFNVLRGDMNIVGPRPERPALVIGLSQEIEAYPLRHLAKPGITGLAQISQAYDSCLDDVKSKVHFDLQYIERQGLLEDIRIMAMTLPVMVFRKGGW